MNQHYPWSAVGATTGASWDIFRWGDHLVMAIGTNSGMPLPSTWLVNTDITRRFSYTVSQ